MNRPKQNKRNATQRKLWNQYHERLRAIKAGGVVPGSERPLTPELYAEAKRILKLINP